VGTCEHCGEPIVWDHGESIKVGWRNCVTRGGIIGSPDEAARKRFPTLVCVTKH